MVDLAGTLGWGMHEKPRAPRNRTLFLQPEERERLRSLLLTVDSLKDQPQLPSGTICGDCLEVVPLLPRGFVDLLVLDPPYNLSKDFHGVRFTKLDVDSYTRWLDSVLKALKPLLTPTASIYICGEWFSSVSIFLAASTHFTVRSRVTWEREKGRGAKGNWKNSSEGIWFCTMSDEYTFNVDAVKLRRRVIAPYRNGDGTPKDWRTTTVGNFRDTHPSNLWTDITVPFWSMPENTDHPTQKSEKLIAKIVLASSLPGGYILDPFLGSGTTSVVAKKLRRQYLGIEINEPYCLLAERRLELAGTDRTIQGLSDGVFWERNTFGAQNGEEPDHPRDAEAQGSLHLGLG
jgi:site-specific DNA-methyltransferase (adenine-specific)